MKITTEGERRKLGVAKSLFQEARQGPKMLPHIQSVEGWEYNGKDTFICTVICTNSNGGSSIKGYYKVEFKTTRIATGFSWDI
jgi:hypothetical protein